MKRLTILILALILVAPAVLRAQTDDPDQQNTEYRDVNDGQFLKLVSYVLTPMGMALEWGLMRPLHYLATQTSAAPVLSGDTPPSFFDENNNASHVPPGTFGPPAINPTNTMQASNGTTTLVPAPPPPTTLAPAQSIPPSKPQLPGNQPALH
jgi:hypothetical protein